MSNPTAGNALKKPLRTPANAATIMHNTQETT